MTSQTPRYETRDALCEMLIRLQQETRGRNRRIPEKPIKVTVGEEKMNFQTILVPIQFNDSNSVEALRMARRLTAENHARMIVLHVIPRMVKPDLPGYGDLFPKDEGEARRELEKLADAYLPDGSYEVMVKSGDPAQIINSVGREIGADLIVIATHGRRGLSHLIMGSVTEKVVREASCAVLTVRPPLAQAQARA